MTANKCNWITELEKSPFFKLQLTDLPMTQRMLKLFGKNTEEWNGTKVW